MLQDPNVEMYIADVIKPLKKQIVELKKGVESLKKQLKNKKNKAWAKNG